jgi:hypothetical protein
VVVKVTPQVRVSQVTAGIGERREERVRRGLGRTRVDAGAEESRANRAGRREAARRALAPHHDEIRRASERAAAAALGRRL